LAYEAIQHGVADYILKPLLHRFYKVNLKVEKSEFSAVVLAHPHVLERSQQL
jgi:hypothetical protein